MPNNRTETNPAITPRLESGTSWRGVVYPTRSAGRFVVKFALSIATAFALMGNEAFGNLYLGPWFGTPVVAGDKLVFAEPGSEPHRLICISKGDGKKLWEINKEKSKLQSWGFRDNQVIVTLGAEVQGCDPLTGKLTLLHRTPYARDVSLLMESGGVVFVQGQTNNVDFLTCLDYGSWQSQWEVSGITMIRAVGQEALLCVQATRNTRDDGSYTLGNVHWVALSKSDGKVLWSCEPFTTATTVGNYFLVNLGNTISCLDQRDGAISKQFTFAGEPYKSNTTLLSNDTRLLVQTSGPHGETVSDIFFALTVPDLQWQKLTQEEWSRASEARSGARDDDYIYLSSTDGQHASMNRIGIKSGNRQKLYEEPLTQDPRTLWRKR